MDNRIFNVNGSSKEMLLAALQLAFMQVGSGDMCKGFKVDNEKGLILYWGGRCDGVVELPCRMGATEVCEMVWKWLNSEDSKQVKLSSVWDIDQDHDGSNSKGWRVYCEDWGHVGNDRTTLCAITPAYMWHGK